MSPMTDYSDRYSTNWSSVSAKVKRSQSPYEGNVKCACCGKVYPWQDTETHHLYYIPGNDGEAGLNLVAVCGSTTKPGTCHYNLHSPKYYLKDPISPKWGNRNTPEVILQMQNNWKAIQQELTGTSFPTTYPVPTAHIPKKDRYKEQLDQLALLSSMSREKHFDKPISSLQSWGKAATELAVPLGILVVILLVFIYTL